MNEEPYKNREIDVMFGEITETLDRIETQTTTTNGRVSKLEKWQNYVLGFCGAIALLVIPVLVYVVAHKIP